MASNRTKKILAGIDLDTMTGLEIGPLHNPILGKDKCKVYYVDHASTDDLKNKYKDDHNVDCSKIPHIDFIWSGDAPLRLIIPSEISFDFIVASHVIEHLPDMIGWFEELGDILKPGGKICLAIPDRRYTFDKLRRVTGLSELIDSYFYRYKRPVVRQVFDSVFNFGPVDIYKTWDDPDNVMSSRTHSIEGVLNLCTDIINNPTVYHDVHCSVFTYESFLKIFVELFSFGLMNFRIVRTFAPEKYANEFFVVLEKINADLSGEERKEIQVEMTNLLASEGVIVPSMASDNEDDSELMQQGHSLIEMKNQLLIANSALAEKTMALQEIYSSRGWKLLKFLYAVRDKFRP